MKLIQSASQAAVLVCAIFSTSVQADTIEVPFQYAKGQQLFQQNCSACHGSTLKGSEQGPPLLHPFYKPSHHGDASFYRAGLKGVKAHHWKFGDMPAVPGMTEAKMKSIIQFIRYYQKQQQLY